MQFLLTILGKGVHVVWFDFGISLCQHIV